MFPSARVQQQLNSVQLSFVATMMRLRWNGQGPFHEWEIRRRRTARAVLHNLKVVRWGDVRISQFWAYSGHRVRNGWSHSPSAEGNLSHFRTLEWWTERQARGHVTGVNHERRRFPQLMNHERAIQACCQEEDGFGGVPWRTVAIDRVKWKQLGRVFQRKQAVPWAMGQQLSLCV